jgi:glutaminyl-tRNA synthetase
VRLYDRLYSSEAPEGIDDLNPDSLKIIDNALIEPAVITEKPDVRFQFERQGYFFADPVDYRDDAPVFNKIVGLKDSWGKKTKTAKPTAKPASKPQKPQVDGEEAPMSDEEQQLFERYTRERGLNTAVAGVLARDAQLASFYEDALNAFNSPVTIANMVANEVNKELKANEAEALKFNAAQIAELAKMVDEATISSKIAKQVFEEMAASGDDPAVIVETKGLVQISDPAVIGPVIDEVIANNPDNVAKYKDGNKKLFGFFVGQVLKATGGKANPKVVNDLITQKLA